MLLPTATQDGPGAAQAPVGGIGLTPGSGVGQRPCPDTLLGGGVLPPGPGGGKRPCLSAPPGGGGGGLSPGPGGANWPCLNAPPGGGGVTPWPATPAAAVLLPVP